MNWSKAKTILIIIFSIINIFLCITIFALDNDAVAVSKDVISSTVDVLHKNNIELESELPLKIKNLPECEMQNPVDDMQKLAVKLLGEDVQKEEIDGGIRYFCESEKLEVKGCMFEYEDLSCSKKIDNSNAAKKAINSFFKEIDFNTKNIKLLSIKENEKTYDAVYVQSYSGKDIYGLYYKASVSSEGLKHISGYLLVPHKFKSNELTIMHPTVILINFIRNNERPHNKKIVIDEITLGYYLNTQDPDIDIINTKTAQAVLVWKIHTHDGNNYYYNARNGEYIKREKDPVN